MSISNNNRLDSLHFNVPKRNTTKPTNIIKVIGVGGSGCNAVNYMFAQGIKDVDFVICNTDAQALESSPVPTKIQLGMTVSGGLGAGAQPERGKNAAIESEEELLNMIDDHTKMVFVTAGMGGGTGTGAAPIIAKMCRDKGILTIGIVTAPFEWEGGDRWVNAMQGLEELEKEVDSLIIIENDKLDALGDMPLAQAFAAVDNILCNAAKGIAEIITSPSTVNVDFEDVRTVLKDSGRTVMNTGRASGEGRAIKAIEAALNTPLISDNDIEGSRRMLLFVSSPSASKHQITTSETKAVGRYIQQRAGNSGNAKGASLIWGMHYDETLTDEIVATVVAAGFSKNQKNINNAPDANTSNNKNILQINADGTATPTLQPNAIGVPVQPITNNNTDTDDEPTFEITAAAAKLPKRTTLFITDNTDNEIPDSFEYDQNSLTTTPNKLHTQQAAHDFKDKRKYEIMDSAPAFMRRNVNLGIAPNHSSHNDISQHSIDRNGNITNKYYGSNGFLHKKED